MYDNSCLDMSDKNICLVMSDKICLVMSDKNMSGYV
jgi:hypothetical protein